MSDQFNFSDYPYTNFNEINLDYILETIKQIADQSQGEPGVGVPTGGTTGQVLTKASDTDYDTEWSDVETSDVEYFDVTLTLAPGGAYYNSNKTPAQIVAAITAGQTVRAILSADDDTEYSFHLSYRPATFDGEYYTEDHVSILLMDGRTISCEGSRTVWPFDSVVGQYDSQLSLYSTNAVENRVITEAIQNIQPSQEDIQDAVDAWLDDHEASIDGLSFEAKNALLTILRHVAYTDANAQEYYSILENALVGGATLSSITAVFDPGSAVFYENTSLDTLRQYLTVTAIFSDASELEVVDYSLSGELEVGTSVITVTYEDKTTTFNVTVAEGIRYTILENQFTRKVQNQPDPPYYSAGTSNATKRLSYTPFDILLTGGKSYRFVATSTYNTAQMGMQFFNQIALDAVNNNTSFSNSNQYDPGWQNLDVTIAVPATVNDSPIVGVRFTFRQSSSNPVLNDAFKITELVVEEVTG